MNTELLNSWAKERAISKQDALQNFLQVIALKNMTLEKARFIGGTALVLAHGNPRFSEDLDFGGVRRPWELQKDMERSAREIQDWLGAAVEIRRPKKGGTTWKLICAFGPSESLRLHIDTQPYRALTHFPALIRFPGIPPFVAASVELDEIMADKIMALAQRRYLGGRDLFDLWFHWLKSPDRDRRKARIRRLLLSKLKQRALRLDGLAGSLKERLGLRPTLDRARQEWRRYLPDSFQKESLYKDILSQAGRIREIISEAS